MGHLSAVGIAVLQGGEDVKMEGMRDLETRPWNQISYNDLIEKWGQGCFEMVNEMVQYAEYVETKFQEAAQADKEVCGVFDYEVSVPFGTWFADYVYAHAHAPIQNEAHQKIDELVEEFFSS